MTGGRLSVMITLACLVVALAGCGDRQSVARLQMRRDRLQSLSHSVARSEARRSEYAERNARMLEEKWERDTERFHQRVSAVGDYFW